MNRLAANLLGRFSMDVRGVPQSERFLLWIDAVGGYWICLGHEVMLGQPEGGAAVDVPILGDLASRHARIRRDGDGYLIEALHEVRIDDRPVHHVGWLRDGSRIQLGRSVRLVFRQPHALSGSARLDFVSRHRTQPSSDAVLLMADTCVLGPKRNGHVVCRNWTQEVILYRLGRELYCKTPGPFAIDGAACRDCGQITRNSRVQGEGFAFALDEREAEGPMFLAGGSSAK
jgi:hypothetical protein